MSCVQPCFFLAPLNESNFSAAALRYTSATSAALWRVSVTGPTLTFFLKESPHEKTADVAWIIKFGNNFRTFQGKNCMNTPEWSWIMNLNNIHNLMTWVFRQQSLVPVLLFPQLSCWLTVFICLGLPPVVEMARSVAITIHRSYQGKCDNNVWRPLSGLAL